MTIRVLVVDDQPVVRDGFRSILDREPDIAVIGEASDGLGAIAEAERTAPDVVLMDVRMPILDGIEATRRITRAHPDTRVLVLTTFDLDEYVYGALQAGASGFVLKDLRRDQLCDAVRVVAAGDALLAPSVTRRLIGHYSAHRPPEGGTASTDDLTPREVEVVRLVAQGLSNLEIGARLHIGEATVKSHVSHVLNKLALRDRVQIAIYAFRNGLAGGS